MVKEHVIAMPCSSIEVSATAGRGEPYGKNLSRQFFACGHKYEVCSGALNQHAVNRVNAEGCAGSRERRHLHLFASDRTRAIEGVCGGPYWPVVASLLVPESARRFDRWLTETNASSTAFDPAGVQQTLAHGMNTARDMENMDCRCRA